VLDIDACADEVRIGFLTLFLRIVFLAEKNDFGITKGFMSI
jgi:hypothetical protein